MTRRYKYEEIKKFPTITGATLISIDECDEGGEYIPDEPSCGPTCWYLRDALEDGEVPYAAGGSFDGSTSPDYYDFPPEGESGTGVRPALIAEDMAGFDPKIELGDEIIIGNWNLTVITPKLILCNDYIDTEIFDENTNVYEDSDVKKRVDAWFENEIKPHLK